MTAQNSSFATGQIITIGKDGYYVIDANQSILKGLENGTYTDTVEYKGLPISVAKEEDGLEDNALWEIVDGVNQSNQNVKFLKNVATGNYLGMYLEWSPQRYYDIRVYKDDSNNEVHIAPISCKYAPYELSETTIYNGGTITIWTLFNANLWIHFTLEYKDGKWQVIVLDWNATYNAAVNSIGTTQPEVFNSTEETATTYELAGIQSAYPVAGGGGIFNMMSDVVVNKIDGTYYESNTGTKVYTNKTITELNVKSVSLTETSTKINGQVIKDDEITFPENTTTEPRNSIIDAEYTFEENTETKTLNTSIKFTQVPKIDVSELNFLHKNNNIQPVHSDTRIIYAIPNQKRHLALPLEGNSNYKKGFYRWYNYETDGTVKALLFGNAHWEKFANNKGTFLYEGDHLDTNSPDGTYYMFTGNPIKVAVDISQYTDYNISNNNFTEPTLSNRVIYDIRNASEIANKLDATNQQLPLEHYTYYAPCNKTIHIGPAYKWTGADCNYFINNGGEFPVSISKTACWTKNDVDFSVSEIYDDRLIPITTPSSLANPDEYILYANTEKTKVIAHFHVYASPQDNIGPKLETEGGLYTNTELNKNYKLIDSIDFNNIEINTPLDWDQSTYGFYYNDINRANGLSGGLIDGEYGLFRTRNNLTNRSWIDKNGQTQYSGSFVYVKTNQYPGKIADLKIEDGENLCPGAPVFISAWVANVGETGTTPHASLRFVVYGVNDDGKKTNIMTYVTGEIPTGGWAQILFQVQLSQIFYDEYHVHIENNGHTTSNDFAIDDIRMYTTKPLLSGISGLSACDMTKEKNVAALRVDYCQLTNLYGNDSLYYQWHNGKADNLGSVLDLNYINRTRGSRFQPCGAIEIINQFIPAYGQEPNFTKETITAIKGDDKYYPSIEAFLYSNDASNNGADGVHEIYTIEDGHIILYIVHSSDLFQEGNYYTAQIMQRVPDFSHNVSCGAYYTYEVRPRTALTIDGIVYDDAVLKNLSINGKHTLGIQVYGFDQNGDIAKSTANADWFKLPENMLSNEVVSALRNFRYEYPTATVLQPVRGAFETRDYTLLNSLISGNLLKLNLANIQVTINEGISNYIAIPVIATSFSPEFMACDNPLYITLGAEVTMSYAKSDGEEDYVSYEDLPEELKGSPTIIRVAYSDVNSLNSITFKIDYLGEGFTSLVSNEVVHCTADHKGPTVYEITTNVTEENCLHVDKTLILNKVNNNFKFEAGHSYVFHCKGYEDDTKVNPGTFIIQVVPDVVIWKPKHAGLSTAWHNDDNWASIESYNNPYATTRGFIPTSKTNVIIPALTDTKYAPLLSKSNKLEDGSNEHLEYEYGIEFNTCKNIYFDENAALANHHKLKYENAYIDMHFDNNDGTFELKSVPLNDVYSGDFYIPKEGDETTTGNIETFNFGTPAAVNTRVANKFRQKTFNASVTQYAGTEQNVVKCETSTWSEPTNALDMPWQVGRGYAIAKQTTTDQNYVRLPKTATEYCFYYDNNGQEGEIPFNKTTIARSANAKELAYKKGYYNVTIQNDVEGKVFLVGNPFMCNLSIEKLYLNHNGDLEDKFYYTYKDGVLNVELFDAHNDKYINPLEAVFVVKKTTSKSLTLSFEASMMYYREYDETTQLQTPIRRAKELNEILTITAKRNDKISKTTIKLSSNATTQYSVGEDVPLLLLDPELTPFAIYSIVDSQAVAYNTVDDIYMIPLSINVIDGEEMDNITFEFSGIDNLSQFVYLYDSYEDRYISLAEGDIFNYNVEENQEVRYYITSRRVGETPTDLDESMIETVKILNLGEGQLMIYASENIISLNVYDLTGKLIVSEQNIDAPQYNIALPQNNVYMFEVITESTVSNQKVATK
ncbi:MAG: hypothetical protein J6B65_06205, partial [Paludibacteraceae bacterium]|nr:hypothetical protein [Paludibacteraceae bacterium]